MLLLSNWYQAFVRRRNPTEDRVCHGLALDAVVPLIGANLGSDCGGMQALPGLNDLELVERVLGGYRHREQLGQLGLVESYSPARYTLISRVSHSLKDRKDQSGPAAIP